MWLSSRRRRAPPAMPPPCSSSGCVARRTPMRMARWRRWSGSGYDTVSGSCSGRRCCATSWGRAMSDLRITCSCGEPLRAGANYCAGCGQEVHQTCPACGEGERRWLRSILPATSPWCENRGALLAACERCGRWLLPDARRCPDPACESRVLPTAPQHTGRRWDGRGGTAGWIWPARWEAIHPQFRPPLVDRWASPDPLVAAFAAHDRLYVWAGVNLLALTGDSGVASCFGTTEQASGALWRAAL